MKTSKTIVVTGVSRGLGRALVTELAQSGHTVCGCARSAEAIEAVRAEHGPPHRFAAVNVADDAAVQQWAEALLADDLVPDLLVNNAAVINRNARLWDVPDSELQTVMDVNVRGVVNVIRHFVPAMIGRRRGVIVNLSSYWGRSGAADVGPYCASKFAVEGLTQSLAEELPAGMAAVALNPGIIDTPMLRSCFGEAAGRYLSPVEWARQAAPFLLQLGREHNGQALTVPGQ